MIRRDATSNVQPLPAAPSHADRLRARPAQEQPLHAAVAARTVWPLPRVDASDAARDVERADEPLAVEPSTAVAQLHAWLELVKTWNRKIDLTAAKGDPELADLGVLDAVQLAGRIARNGGVVVDVGSGFGAPGVAVAILRPDLEVRLVEPLRKRATFLRTVLGTLGLTARVEVMECRGEQVADAGARFAAAISRATLAPAAWLALGDRLAPEGEVAVLLAREAEPEHPSREVAWRATYETSAAAPRLAVGYRRRRDVPLGG